MRSTSTLRRIMALVRKNHRWATIVELMIVLAILSLGIGALLETLRWGILYSTDTENNIKAINIAREWIEAMTNIRDTNWLRFSSDKINCWKAKDYLSTCIGDGLDSSSSKIQDWKYIIYSRSWLWFLTGATTGNNVIWLDSNGFYTQTGVSTTPCSAWRQTDCRTIFTREITLTRNGTGTLLVTSVASWRQQRPRNVTLETTLTNWKSKF